jgi:hypothetical protein
MHHDYDLKCNQLGNKNRFLFVEVKKRANGAGKFARKVFGKYLRKILIYF